MLNKQTHNDYYRPLPQSVPFIEPKSLKQESKYIQSANMNVKNRYLSNKYDMNQSETQRGSYPQQRLQNACSFQMRNNGAKNNKISSASQQLGCFKLNRISHHTNRNQVYKNTSQYNLNLDNQSKNKDRTKININNSSSQQSSFDGYSQSRNIIQQNINNVFYNEKILTKQNDFKMTNRPKSGHLISFGNLSPFKQKESNSNHNSKKSSLHKTNQNLKIYDKENYQPNSSYESNSNNQQNSNYQNNQQNSNYQNNQQNSNHKNQSDFQSQQSIQRLPIHKDIQNTNNNQNIKLNQTKTLFYEHPTNQNNADFIKKNKTSKSQSQLLIPAINTMGAESHPLTDSNFHSNTLIDQSSISPLCDSSRISQQDTQITYLKQKLIQTHTKLIKQLEISKQLEDNFFALKKKYQTLLNANKNVKTSQNSQKIIYQLQCELKSKQEELVRKQQELRVKQQKWVQKQTSLFDQISQHRAKECQRTKQLSSLDQINRSLKQQIRELSEQCNYLNQQVQNYKTSAEELLSENEDLKSELNEFRKNENCLTQKINQLQLKKYTSTDLQQILDTKQTFLNQQLNQNKNNFIEETQKLIHKNQQLKNDLENMRNKVLSLNKQKQQLFQELQLLKQNHQKYQIQIYQLQEKLSKKHKQFTQKQQLCQIWRKKYSQTQEESNKFQENIIKHQNQTKQLKNLNSQLNIALRQQKEKNAQMLSEIINIQMETKDLKSKINSLQQEKKELQDKLFQVTPQKNTLHQKQQLEHQLQKLTTEYNSLSAIINKKDKDISQLKAQLLESHSVINKFSVREKELQQKSRQLDRMLKEVEQRQRQLDQQKMSNMNSVKNFVNQLQDQKDRSVALKRTSQQLNRQNRAKTPTNIQKQNVFNNSNLKNQSSSFKNDRSVSPILQKNLKTTPLEEKRNERQFDESFNDQQNNQQNIQGNNRIQSQNNCLTPSKSLNNLNIKTINNNRSHALLNHQQDSLMNIKIAQQKTKRQSRDLNYQQNFIAEYQSYQDSLQINKIPINTPNLKKPIKNSFQLQPNDIGVIDNKKQRPINDQKSYSLTPFKENKNNLLGSQSKLRTMNGSQKCLSSYKEEKHQYLSLLEQIGELETQSYNLGQEKKKILQELEKIENTKVKTKEMIGRRRQLELWLLGNEKKNNEVRQKLKLIRGKVV